MGMLIANGTLRVQQFWPGGRSDADTATIDLVPQASKAFTWVDNAGKRQPTRVFDNAEVVSKSGRKPAIKTSKNSTARKITIRLQGLDAPELHYQPQVPGSGGQGINHPFRQWLGETSANALHDFLKGFGQTDIPCEFLTVVQKPSEVCDMFGRFVGNIVLIQGGARIDINQWLVREGWAMPGFYNSMLNHEILAVLAEHDDAKKAGRGLYSKKIITDHLAGFDPKRVERKGPQSFKPFSDKGPVNFPKFFRRQAELYVRRAVGQNVPMNLRAFIASKGSDYAIRRDACLKLKGPRIGKKPRPEFQPLATFLAGDRYPTGPEVVYWESDSALVRAGTNTEIKSW
jgi:endonuclease YncB( thermonuclease family)